MFHTIFSEFFLESVLTATPEKIYLISSQLNHKIKSNVGQEMRKDMNVKIVRNLLISVLSLCSSKDNLRNYKKTTRKFFLHAGNLTIEQLNSSKISYEKSIILRYLSLRNKSLKNYFWRNQPSEHISEDDIVPKRNNVLYFPKDRSRVPEK